MRVHEDHLQISWLFGVQFLPDADQVSKFYRGRITQISNKHAFTWEHNPLWKAFCLPCCALFAVASSEAYMTYFESGGRWGDMGRNLLNATEQGSPWLWLIATIAVRETVPQYVLQNTTYLW